MPKLDLRGVVKQFGDHMVCNGIDLVVEEGQMVCLIGASGAGKSTLLRCINLLEPIEDGAIYLDGQDISVPGLNPQSVRARIGIVFQSFNLFPHMTALENVMLAPAPRQGAVACATSARGHSPVRAVWSGRPDEQIPRSAFRWAATARSHCARPCDETRSHAV